MTIKAWRIDHDWQEAFVSALTGRGASGQAVARALAEVDDALAVSGSTAEQQFGEPKAYAATVTIVRDADTDRASQSRAVLLAVFGLLGMFLTLWGFTAIAREVDTVIGLSPYIPLVLGIVIVLAAALADTALGRRADFIQAELGRSRAEGAGATLVNRLAPWLIVLLTAVGMALIWIRYR